jgi:crotonobetainyl-CoA:carnitine CoA-transferase CaiB-like acyl-CoA transferase
MTAASRYRAHVSDRAAPINAAHARRQLAARQFIPDEPRRATYAAVDLMVAELPYGFWKAADGRVVIFNRRYSPIWQRFADGEIRRANSGEWVRWIEERWFDADRIRYEKSTRARLREILRKFFAGEDLERFTTNDVRYRAPAACPAN